jgi:DNA-directed RNA polymerase subunit L
MNKISDINYKLISYDNEIGSSRLELNIKGSNINHIIVNTIRHAIFTYVPIYAFTQFNFSKNESIFNNNYIKLRLKNFPVWGINNNNDIFVAKDINQEEILDETGINIVDENNDDIDMETNNDINTSSINQLTMYVDYTSSTTSIVSVTTEHAKFYHAEKNIPSPYKTPIPIIKLQPNQSIVFSAITSLGIEQDNAMFSPVSVCFYKQKSDNEYEFILESRGQLTEQRIIEVAIINIINKLENIYKTVTLEQPEARGEIIIFGENNTFGNLISYGMQLHKNVKFAGYNVPHLLEEKVIIHYELINDKIKINDVISDVLEYFKVLYNEILLLNKNIIKDGKKSIKDDIDEEPKKEKKKSNDEEPKKEKKKSNDDEPKKEKKKVTKKKSTK